jgi:hypothetical protein
MTETELDPHHHRSKGQPMTNLKALPDEVSSLYSTSNDWTRDFPWSYAKTRVAIPRSFFGTQRPPWEISSQLRRANNAARHRETMAAKKRG